MNYKSYYEKLHKLAFSEDFTMLQRKFVPEEPMLNLDTVSIALDIALEEDHPGDMSQLLFQYFKRKKCILDEPPLKFLSNGKVMMLSQAISVAGQYPKNESIIWFVLMMIDLKKQGKIEEIYTLVDQLLDKDLNFLDDHSCLLVSHLISHLLDAELDYKPILPFCKLIFDDAGFYSLILSILKKPVVHLELVLDLISLIKQSIIKLNCLFHMIDGFKDNEIKEELLAKAIQIIDTSDFDSKLYFHLAVADSYLKMNIANPQGMKFLENVMEDEEIKKYPIYSLRIAGIWDKYFHEEEQTLRWLQASIIMLSEIQDFSDYVYFISVLVPHFYKSHLVDVDQIYTELKNRFLKEMNNDKEITIKRLLELSMEIAKTAALQGFAKKILTLTELDLEMELSPGRSVEIFLLQSQVYQHLHKINDASSRYNQALQFLDRGRSEEVVYYLTDIYKLFADYHVKAGNDKHARNFFNEWINETRNIDYYDKRLEVIYDLMNAVMQVYSFEDELMDRLLGEWAELFNEEYLADNVLFDYLSRVWKNHLNHDSELNRIFIYIKIPKRNVMKKRILMFTLGSFKIHSRFLEELRAILLGMNEADQTELLETIIYSQDSDIWENFFMEFLGQGKIKCRNRMRLLLEALRYTESKEKAKSWVREAEKLMKVVNDFEISLQFVELKHKWGTKENILAALLLNLAMSINSCTKDEINWRLNHLIGTIKQVLHKPEECLIKLAQTVRKEWELNTQVIFFFYVSESFLTTFANEKSASQFFHEGIRVLKEVGNGEDQLSTLLFLLAKVNVEKQADIWVITKHIFDELPENKQKIYQERLVTLGLEFQLIKNEDTEPAVHFLLDQLKKKVNKEKRESIDMIIGYINRDTLPASLTNLIIHTLFQEAMKIEDPEDKSITLQSICLSIQQEEYHHDEWNNIVKETRNSLFAINDLSEKLVSMISIAEIYAFNFDQKEEAVALLNQVLDQLKDVVKESSHNRIMGHLIRVYENLIEQEPNRDQLLSEWLKQLNDDMVGWEYSLKYPTKDIFKRILVKRSNYMYVTNDLLRDFESVYPEHEKEIYAAGVNVLFGELGGESNELS